MRLGQSQMTASQRAAAICLSLFALNYAGNANAITPRNPDMVRVSPPNEDKLATPLLKQFALMALFAKTAYRKDIEDEAARDGNGCNYTAYPPTDLPSSLRWKRLEREGACYDRGGLFYETYVHADDNNEYDMAVIAIRGTEFKSYRDWKSSLSGIIPSHKNEYIAAKESIIPLLSDLKQMGIPRIYLTGHSLGGGLAQEIAYLSDAVTATYTFNTSPVTGWMKAKAKGDVKVEHPVIHRVYTAREVLSYIRKVTRFFNHKLPNRVDYRFNYVRTSNPIKAHDMSLLTCHFAAKVLDDGAEFGYSKDAAAAVLNNRVLCPDTTRKRIAGTL